ncbi:C-X-C chemokine receptor type 2-like [Actinia tenebrosa]|uniref:C-X-C chemokine receptor type 2-like n=1 Tax=Actinia tenebrosa TaxID=6105 RepID=A0A6P8I8L8_ACTTE|nr:C-X-C chemokine receptor type 2-like [Actinia tenebrosa]
MDLAEQSVQNSSFNASSSQEKLVDFRRFDIQTLDILFGSLYAFIVCVGVVGNCLVLAVVKRTSSMHSTTNYLLVNLAVADIITLLWNPRTYSFAFYSSHPRGTLGDYLCKLFTGNGIIGVAIGASVLTLSTIAVERYHALVKPLTAGKLKIQFENVRYVIAGIWSIALLINLPDFVANRFDAKYGRCICPYSLESITDFRAHVLCTVFFLGGFPLLILGFCYFQIIKGIFFEKTIMGQAQGQEDDKSKRKLAKLLLSVTMAFYTCYLPYGIFMSFLTLSKRKTLIENQNSYTILLKTVEFLVTFSSFLNPVLYAFQSSNYRNGFVKICRFKRSVLPAKENSVTFNIRDFNEKQNKIFRMAEPRLSLKIPNLSEEC